VAVVVMAQAVAVRSLWMREPVCRALQKTFAATAIARTSAHKNTATKTMGLEPIAETVPPDTLELRTTGHPDVERARVYSCGGSRRECVCVCARACVVRLLQSEQCR
jgi:hypothetical protein